MKISLYKNSKKIYFFSIRYKEKHIYLDETALMKWGVGEK